MRKAFSPMTATCSLVAVGVFAVAGAACSERAIDEEASESSQAIEKNVDVASFAANDIIKIRSSARVAGAIDSLQFGGKEFINSFDHGRQLQVAVIGNNLGECYNPTEAGSLNDGVGPSSSSVLRGFFTQGNVMASDVQPAFWLAPGQSHVPFNQFDSCVKANNSTVTSPYSIRKHVTVGYKGIRHTLEFLSEIVVPEHLSAMQVEAPTAYLNGEFSALYGYQLDTDTLLPVSPTFNEQELPPIIATANGSHAMGVWSPDLPNAGSASRYAIGTFPSPDPRSVTSKWSAVMRRGDTPPGVYPFRAYVIVGSLENVRVAMRQTRELVLAGGGGVAPMPSIVPQGLFKVGEGVYFSNGSRYCGFSNWADYVAISGKKDLSGVFLAAQLPNMPTDGACKFIASEGVFKTATTPGAIHYSNGSAFCTFPSMASFTAKTGLKSDAGIRVLHRLPDNKNDGSCGEAGAPDLETAPTKPTPTPPPPAPLVVSGLFKVGAGIYFSNGTRICGFSNWNDYVAISGRTEINGIRELPRLPDMPRDGACQFIASEGVFKTAATPGAIHYSNGSAFCTFPSWQSFVAKTGRTTDTGIRVLHRVPDNKNDGACR